LAVVIKALTFFKKSTNKKHEWCGGLALLVLVLSTSGAKAPHEVCGRL